MQKAKGCSAQSRGLPWLQKASSGSLFLPSLLLSTDQPTNTTYRTAEPYIKYILGFVDQPAKVKSNRIPVP